MARASEKVDVLVVCSSGGHLSDACAIADAWSMLPRAWVSFDKPDVRSLLCSERVYFGHGPTNRNVPNLVRNLRVAWRLIGRTRPRVLVTTGAGIGVPFAWVARLRGARVIYVECAGRIDRPSLSGRMIAPVAHAIYAQWPELAERWRPARYAGNVLFAQPSRPSTASGKGVLVTVGTNEAPFDRLVHAAARLAAEPVIVQRGASTEWPACTRCVDYVPFDELDSLVRSSRVVVTHAGVGSVAAALANGRKPVVVPRLHRFGEAVDDHQVFFARRLQREGLVTLVEDLDLLADAVASAEHTTSPAQGPVLSDAIHADIRAILGGGAIGGLERGRRGLTRLGAVIHRERARRRSGGRPSPT